MVFLTGAEVAEIPNWRKSSRSGAAGHCVNVAELANGDVAVSHSRHPEVGGIVYTPAEWDAFVAGVRAGEFDRGRL